MNKNEVELVRSLGDLENAIGGLLKQVSYSMGSGYGEAVAKALTSFKDKFYNILLDEPEN
jgi:hypothetical protein